MKSMQSLVVAILAIIFNLNIAMAATVNVSGSGTDQNVSVNVPNQFLGQFTVTVTDEPVSFGWISLATGTTNEITNATIVDWQNTVVAGPIDSQGGILVFTDTVVFPVGEQIYTIKGKLPNSFLVGEKFALSTVPVSDWQSGFGQITGVPIDAGPTNTVVSATVTAKRGFLGLNTPAPDFWGVILPGGVNQYVGEYVLDASESGEDVSLASIPVGFEGFSGLKPDDVFNVQVLFGDIILNIGHVLNPVNFGDMLITLDSRFIVPKGTKVTLSVRAGGIKDSARGGMRWGWSSRAEDDCHAIGLATGNPVTVRAYNYDGPGVSIAVTEITQPSLSINGMLSFEGTNHLEMTFWAEPGVFYDLESTADFVHWRSEGVTIMGDVSSGAMETIYAPIRSGEAYRFFRLSTSLSTRFSVSTDASSPSYFVAAAGSVGNTILVAKFRAPYEDVRLERIPLTLAAGAPLDTLQVTVWDGNTQIGHAVFIGNSKLAVCIPSVPVLLPKGIDKVLTFKVDLAPIGITEPVTESGHWVGIGIDTSQSDPRLQLTGIGVASGVNILGAGETYSEGIRVFKSYPTLELDPLPATGLADGRLLRFKVTAHSAGSVSLGKMKLVFNHGENVKLSEVSVARFSDSSYSQFVSWLDYTGGSQPVLIPAGTTQYFEVRGNVQGGSTGDYIITSLLGDFGENSPNFIWSPNTLTSSPGKDDWFNAYGLPGLPAGGITQTRAK